MATPIIMPKAGMAMEEGTIIKWLKKEGERVEIGEPLLEIHTDKVNMEVEAIASGILLEQIRKEGDVVPVTHIIGYIGSMGENIENLGENHCPNDVDTGATSAPEGYTGEIGEHYDVIVIGGGPAGYVAAIKVAQLGGKVALVERDTVGGTCLNRGCIPTKTYLKNTEMIEYIQHAGHRGIIIENPNVKIDMDKVIETKNDVVKSLTTGVAGLLKAHGVTMYKGIGKLIKGKEVQIDEKIVLRGNKIILATGSKPGRIDVIEDDSMCLLDSDAILDLKEIPNHLIIIGGGVIGVEMAMIFRAYGSKVTILELADWILPKMDKEISATLLKVLEKKGISVLTGIKIAGFHEEDGYGILNLGEQGKIQGDKILVSTGRIADLEGMGEIQLEMERGKVRVNEYMETSVEGIYAPGDINGLYMLAHAAFRMGEVAGANAMGHKKRVRLSAVPNCVYTIPEIGTVGLTEEEARKNYDVSIGRFFFSTNGRALASNETIGFVKVVAERVFGEILGVHIIGPGATEIINEAAALMDMQITVHEVSEIIHGHPTFSEAFLEACADCLGKSTHQPPKI